MARARISRRHLAAAVTAALAVTVGTLAAPAVAAGDVAAGTTPSSTATATATATATTTAAEQDAIQLLPNSLLVGNGPSGFLTRRPTTTGLEYRWTRYADGATTTLPQGTYMGSTGSDHVVKSASNVHTVYDMGTGADPVVIDTRPLWPDSRVLAVAGTTLVMRGISSTGAVLDDRLVTTTQGTVVDRKLTGLPAAATVDYYQPVSAGTLLVHYTGSVAGVYGPRVARVDIATAAVVEDHPLPAANGRSDVTMSATHLAWAESTTTAANLAFARKGEPGITRVPLGATGSLWVDLVGDWATYTVPGGLTATAPNPLHALTARSLTTDATVKLLDTVAMVRGEADGTLLVQGGTFEHGEGLYRIAPGSDGTPAATLVASTGRPITLQVTDQTVPETFDFRTSSGDGSLMWQFAMGSTADVNVELTHKASGKRWTLRSYIGSDGRAFAHWDGLLDDHTAATNGEYTWRMTARPKNGIGPAVERTGTLKVDSGQAPHDFSDSGSPDLIFRQSGTLFIVDSRQSLYFGAQTTPELTDIGAGWDAYKHIVTPGNVGGARYSDVVAGDRNGTLWLHVGNGKSGFSQRTRIGGGWQIYDRLTGGSDLDRDGRPDLVATDKAGDLWLYKGTGNATAPFAPRKKIGYGWGAYDKIVATGNIGGNTTGDLVARDKAGVLWLYLGNGDGTFAKRRRIGGGWDRYGEIVGIGDADRDGRPDLVVNGRTGSTDDSLALYRGTGDWKVPFTGRIGLYTPNELSQWGMTLF
ncbi:FG-GAP repeat domain-containing protein [Streptomyces sp. NPDC059352]|uniref:FG-GAP repeat domain-containing protein n=1 Tax=Streptomyces sp. NPDC059352 TaxID=3346810 RepID=UPI0036B6E666